jgi:hypothetical protein
MGLLIGQLEVNVCALFFLAEVNDDSLISGSYTRIVNARFPLWTSRLSLNTYAN